MLEFILAAMLNGDISSGNGRIGIVVSKHGRIGKVYNVSPAKTYGLQVGDVILSAEGKKGIKYVDGDTANTVLLKVKRNKEIMYFRIPRVNKKEIYD